MAKGASLGMPKHWAYLMELWRKVSMNQYEKKKDSNILQYSSLKYLFFESVRESAFSSSKGTRPSGQRCVLKHFWAYPLIKMRKMRGGNLSTAIAPFGGRYARELL